MDYTVKKSNCERYDIRVKHEWAVITIDENGGLFNCHSSYGNYNYSWPCHGRETFKHFLIEILNDKYYFLNKVAKEDYFDADKCREQLKIKVIEWRKEFEINKEEARELWEFIDGIEYDDKTYFEIQLYENSLINRITGGEPWYALDISTDFSPQVYGFIETIMPAFIDVLKKEVD